MLTLLWIIQIISAILLVNMIQQTKIQLPKGDGLGAMGGMANIFSSQKSAESGLNKLTANIAVIFVVSSLITGFKIVTLPLPVIIVCLIPIVGIFVWINRK